MQSARNSNVVAAEMEEYSWFHQYALLLRVLCKLKRWRFLLLLVALASAFSNHFLYSTVKSSMSSLRSTNFEPFGPHEFAQGNFILADWDQFASRKASVEEYYFAQEASAGSMFENCHSDESCESAFFSALFRLSGQSTSLVKYSAAGGSPEIHCQTSLGWELQCALLSSLVLMAEVNSTYRLQRFNTVKMFQVVVDSRMDHSKKQQQVLGDTMCAKELDFSLVMPRTVMVQSLLLLGSVFLYLLAATVPCIGDLKGRWFLQLLFRRGLSVLAYWLALWTVTLLELMLIAAALVVSYHAQCPGFYPTGSLVQVFTVSLGQLSCLTSAVFLLTIAIRDFFHIGVAAVLLTVLCMVLVVLLRIVLSSQKDMEWLRLPTLMLPPGHLAEQVQANLLAHLLPNSLTSYHHNALVLSYVASSALFVVTFYLDYVLPFGNGFRLPLLYLFTPGFWTPEWYHPPLLLDDNEQNPNIEEELDDGLVAMVKVRKLVKTFKRSPTSTSDMEALQSQPEVSIDSVKMYQNHITAVVGHSRSGKTTLMNILAALETPSRGLVSVDDTSMTCPMAAVHSRGRIGVCLQRNALCHGLTVMDSLELLVASCGRSDAEHDDVQNLLSVLHLSEKQFARVGSMTPGQRRKLCVALALLGGPRMVVLDEPTSGVDPFARRRIWRLLQDFKDGRCVVLSTQKMEEADMLADRKIFLSGGSVVCAGSTPFLQRFFDCGFVFQVTLGSERHVNLLLHDVHNRLNRVRTKIINRSQLELQVNINDAHMLPALAEELERRSHYIEHLALTQTSLDEAFTRLRGRSPENVKSLFTAGGLLYVLDEDEEDEEQGKDQQPNATESRIFAPDPGADMEVSHWRSAWLFAGIMRLRLMRNRPKLINRLVAGAVLLAILLTSAVLERHMKNGKILVHVEISNATYMNINSAYCLWDVDAIYGGSNAFHGKSTNRQCQKALKPWNFTSGDSGLQDISVKSKSRSESFLEFYQKNPTSTTELIAHCMQVEQCRVPYPAAYISNVCDCPLEYNRLRDVYIGSVIGGDHYSAPAMAHSAVGVLQTIFYHYITLLKGVPVDPRLRISAIYDYRTMLIPTFGAFFQLILITAVPAVFMDDVIEDRTIRVRYTMSNMGMSLLGYWAATCIVHWVQIAAVYILSVIILICVVPSGYLSAYYFVGIVLPTLLLGITNNQLLVYLISTFIERPNPLIVIGYHFLCVVNALSLLGAQLNHYAGIILIFLVPPCATMAPTFYGAKAIFYALSYHKAQSMSQVPDKAALYVTQLHTVHSLVAMALHRAVLCGLIAASEKRRQILRRISRRRSGGTKVADYQQSDDPGVQKELERAATGVMSNDHVLEVHCLRKSYPHGARVVRGLTFGVAAGEVLGLIGPNGAGKTTTLAAIVGELAASSGSCSVRSPRDRWLPSHLTVATGAIGYCPQHNPLFEQVTVLEHLLFYARLLGLDPLDAKARANHLILLTGLADATDSRAGGLPFGRRRLLTLAIAMLGEPVLLVVDEASTGVDPSSRRALRMAIKSYARCGRSVLLTTHNMDEAEALCDRIGIVNHGLMVCLGTGQRLRELYGGYYTLDMQMDPGRSSTGSLARDLKARLIGSLMHQFPAAKLMDSFTTRVLFSIPVENSRRLSATLKWLFENKARLHVKHFTYRQMSLDSILDTVLMKHDSQMQRQRQGSIFSILSVHSSSQEEHAASAVDTESSSSEVS